MNMCLFKFTGNKSLLQGTSEKFLGSTMSNQQVIWAAQHKSECSRLRLSQPVKYDEFRKQVISYFIFLKYFLQLLHLQ